MTIKKNFKTLLECFALVRPTELYIEHTLAEIENAVPLESKDELRKSTTLEFFNKLYTYPPAYNINLQNNYQPHHQVNNYRSTITPKKTNLDSIDYTGYIKHFQNKLTTSENVRNVSSNYEHSDFFITDNIPVYVILNGSGQIILENPVSNNLMAVSQTGVLNIGYRTATEKIYDFIGSFRDNNFTRESNLGLFFLNKRDADEYMKEILLNDYKGVKLQGISVNCVSLESACNLIRTHHPNFDFRFIPDMQEIEPLGKMISYTQNATGINTLRATLENTAQPSIEGNPILDSCLANHLGIVSNDNLTSANIKQKNYLRTESWSGVPVYLVKTKKHLVNNKHPEFKLQKTCIFFKLLDAENFLSRRENHACYRNTGYDFPTYSISKSTAIRVTSLEDLVEFTDKQLTKAQLTPEQKKRLKRHLFVMDDNTGIKELPHNPENGEKYKQSIVRRYRKIKSFCSKILYYR